MMTAARRYFGTDGIRGEVGRHPITADFFLQLGWAAGRVLARGDRKKVVIGKDTRISGYMFESVLEAGLTAAGVDVVLLGPMPTPAVAYFTRTLRATAGVVISASHNPYTDNGIKFFDADGGKVSDEVELEIESTIDSPMQTAASIDIGRAVRIDDAAGRYIEFCKSTVPADLSLRGLRIVVDCAHGATYHIAPNVFSELGAEVVSIGCAPNGLNINDGFGPLAPGALCEAVRERRADLGIALDGDGDRLLMVDAAGLPMDGDELLFVIVDAHRANGSSIDAVVGTVMTNRGLEAALHARGIELLRAKVGDRNVLDLMRERGCKLGGETSGHLVCLTHTTTGDGIVAALQVLHALDQSGRTLCEARQGMVKYPQALRSVQVAKYVDLDSNAAIRNAITASRTELGERGRVLVRLSGTEPIVRIMVESESRAEAERHAERLVDAVTAALEEP